MKPLETLVMYPLRHLSRLGLVRQIRILVRYQARALIEADTIQLEVITGLFAIAFGLQILQHEQYFRVEYYGYLTEIAPAAAWSFFMTFAGVDKIIAMLTATRWCRRLLAAVMTGVWTFIACVCLLTARDNLAGGTYVIMAFCSVWIFVRLGRQT